MDTEKLNGIARALEGYVSSGDHVLRPLQQTVFHDVAQDVAKGNSKGHIRFPTGGGKGTMIGAEIDALLKADAKGDLPLGERKILVLTPRKLLVDDLYERFVEFGTFPDITPDMVGRRHSDVPEDEKKAALDKPVLVTTYATYQNLVKKGEIGTDAYPVVLLDEAHRTRGDLISQTIKDALPHAYVQGWTATDRYENGKHVGQEVLGREDAIHITSFKDAVEQDILCPVVNHVVRTNIDAGIERSAGTKDYLPEELQKIVGHHARDKMAVEMLANHVEPNTGVEFKDQNSVFYCVGVEHAHRMAEQLNDKFGAGYATAVSGETPKDELKEIMRRYADPEDPLKAVTNADLLIEGWDAPNASLCFMLRPTKSPILAEQTGGRVMRLDPNNPDKVAVVVTFWDDNMPDMVAFGDVIGGHHIGVEAQTREGGAREQDGEERKPAWMRDDIDLSGMEISTDIREIANFTDNIRRDARKDIAAQKPDEQWMASTNLTKALMATGIPGGKAQVEALLEELGEKFAAASEGVGGEPQTIEHKGQTFRMGHFQSGGGVHVHFHAGDMDKFRSALGLSEMLPEQGWLRLSQLREQLGAEYGADAMKPKGVVGELLGEIMMQTSRDMDAAGKQFGATPLTIDGVELHAGKFGVAGKGRGVHTMAVAFYEEDIDALKVLIESRMQGKQATPKAASWAERVGRDASRSIKPDSPHISDRNGGAGLGI